MELLYKSTRSTQEKITSSEAIVKGIASDGGLYVPTHIPHIDKSLKELMYMDYREMAFYIMNQFLPDFDGQELVKCISKAYDDKFSDPSIAPLTEKNGVFFLELYHGPTLAFKDMALSILPHLLTTAAKKVNLNKEIIILTATSGDTGKAALEGFANVPNTKVIVFFPDNGVSEIQKRQMITQEGNNTYVIGIRGNFDDAQNGVKEIFNDKQFNKKLNENNYMFSSANSINVGRLIPQIVYYFHSYTNLLRKNEINEGEKINIAVPTGNFGNILAAYYAKKMGLPVNKLICASNENNVLTDFFKTGIYNRNRRFIKTISPSMDILISSNLERLLYTISRQDENLINTLMKELKEKGIYEIPAGMKNELNDFYADFATEDETYNVIKEVYESSNYLIDTHTAVAYQVYKKYKKDTSDNTKTVIASTASPFKFTRSVAKALNIQTDNISDFKLLETLSEYTGLEVPRALKDIDKKDILHTTVCSKDEIGKIIEKTLEI